MSARYSYAIRLRLDGERITVGVTRENTITMRPDPGVLTADEAHRLAIALVNCAEFAKDQLRSAPGGDS